MLYPKDRDRWQSPAVQVVLITPDDAGELDPHLRGISFATAGILRILDGLGNDVTIPDGALAAGVIHPIRVKRVFSTTTTATDIVGYI